MKLLPLSLFAATLLLAACTSDEPATAPGAAFYAELTFEVDLPPDDPHATPASDTQTALVRWWYAPDPDRWRWEIETTGSILEDGIAMSVFDGDETWTYDDASNAYQRAVYPTFPEGMISSPSFSARLGPANLDSVEEFMQQLQDSSAVADVRLAGESTALNRRTQIVEIRPAWSSGSSATAIAPGSGQDVRPATQDTLTSGGVIRISIDPDRMFIMRSAVDGEGGGQSYFAEITILDYDAAIDPALFTFDPPPPGAREVESTEGQSCRSSSGSAGGSSITVQPGFLLPAYIPSGYHGVSTSWGRGFGCETTNTTNSLQSAGDAYLTLRQRVRPTGISATAAFWPLVAATAFEVGTNRVAWSPNGTRIAFFEDDGLYFVDAALTEKHQLVALEPWTSDSSRRPSTAAIKQAAQRSPNGTRIAYTTGSAIHVVDVATGAITPATPQGVAGFFLTTFVWSPDGNRVAVASEHSDHRGIVIAHADGSGAYQLTHSVAFSILGWSDIGIATYLCRCP